MVDQYLLAGVAVSTLFAIVIGAALATCGFPLPRGVRFGCVDGLRGYLAIFVVFHHFVISIACKTDHHWAEPAANVYNEFGKAAVALFFMATGLVFYPRVVDGFVETDWPSVYSGRLFRIIPMLLVSTLICALIVATEHRVTLSARLPVEILEWLEGQQVLLFDVRTSYQVNAGVFWSIWWEWLFYFLVLPLTALIRQAFARDGMRVMLILLLTLSLLGRLSGMAIFTYLPLFVLGMLIAEIAEYARVRQVFSQPWASLPLLAALVCAATLFHVPYGVVPMALLGGVLLGIAAGNDLFGLLSNRGARMLGEISFCIYVLHGIVLHLAFRFYPVERNQLAVLPILVAVIVVASALLSLAVEKPAIKIGKQCNAALPRYRARLTRLGRANAVRQGARPTV